MPRKFDGNSDFVVGLELCQIAIEIGRFIINGISFIPLSSLTPERPLKPVGVGNRTAKNRSIGYRVIIMTCKASQTYIGISDTFST